MAALYTTEALVLGVHPWGEADKMATLFTRERGKVKAAAFGCRRPKSPLAAGMQMFSLLEVRLQEGRKVDVVRQCRVLGRYGKLSEDVAAMAYGAFVAELAGELFPDHAADPKGFDLLLEIFGAFEGRNPRVTALAAAWQLLSCAGLHPRLGQCVRCGREISGDAFLRLEEGGVLCTGCRDDGAGKVTEGERLFLQSLLELDWKGTEKIRMRRENLLMAEQVLLAYLRGILGKPLKSLEFLRQI